MHASKTDKSQPPVPFERLETRIKPDQKALLKKAAALEGVSLTDFVLGCVTHEAQRIVQEHEALQLSQRDREIFVKTLLGPGEPNQALRKAAAWYREKLHLP